MVLLPEPLASYERFPLLFNQASPLHKLPNLTEHVHQTTPCRAQLWAKREDCSSGLGLGGNKIRKLEYIVPDALAQGCDTLVTTGGVQSNMMRQTAAVAHRLGLKAVLVPQAAHHGAGELDGAFDTSGNVQVNKILGADYLTAAGSAALDDAVARLRAEGARPFAIAAGGSAHERGGLGFARWAFEVAEQELAEGVFFDVVVVPVASGGTLGGMIAGFKLADRLRQASLGGGGATEGRRPLRERKVIGIDTYNKPEGVLEAAILEVAQRTAVLIGLEKDAVQASDVVLDTRHNAGTHTNWDHQAAKGVKLLGRKEGIVSDPIYSGRTIGAVLKMAEIGDLDGKENVLFVHTGGQPALGAFPKMS